VKDKWYYKNAYGIPGKELDPIKARDDVCIYCRKLMSDHLEGHRNGRWETIEHLNYERPFNWNEGSFDINKIAFCCGSCNSSRGKQSISDWFKKETPYARIMLIQRR